MAKSEVSIKSATVEDVLNAYTEVWIKESRILPEFEMVRKYGFDLGLIGSVLNNPTERNKLVRRGLPLVSTNLVSTEQYRCISIVTDPTIKGALGAKLKMAGVSFAVYRNWLKDRKFAELLRAHTRMILDAGIVGAYTGLSNRAETGDINAIKFLMELTGDYDPGAKSVIDTIGILASVVEIIQTEVQDPIVLERIASKIAMVAASKGISRPIQGEIL